MAFTKVVGPGIHTLAQLRTHNIHSAGIITATKFVGEMESGGGSSTFQNVTVSGNLTVQGDTTTLNTTLRNVELLRVAANTNTTAGIITQTGTGDILNLFDATTEVVTVKDGGFVGIGTVDPQRQLHVLGTTRPLEIGSTNATNIVKLYNSGTGRATYNGVDIMASSTDGAKINAYGGYISLGTTATNGVDAVERLRIDTSGRHLIGDSTSRFYAAKLQVQGASDSNYILMHNTTAGDGDGNRYSKFVYSGTQSGGETSDLAHINAAHDGTSDDQKGRLEFRVNAGSADHSPTEGFRLNSDGNLLVGTTSNSGRLCVQGTAAGTVAQFTDATNGTIRISHPSSGVNLIAGGSSQHLALGTGFAEKVRITTAGEVGIGVTNPSSQLDVRTDDDPTNGLISFIRNNTSGGNGAFYGMDVNGVGAFSIGIPDNTDAFTIVDGLGNSGTERLHINSSGQTTIHAAANQTLFLNRSGGHGQSSVALQSNGTTKWIVGSDKDNGNSQDFFIYDQANGAHRFNISSTGNVGVGTAAPGQKVHLTATSGDGYFRADTNVNGGFMLYVQGTQRSVFANDSAFSGTQSDTAIGAKGNLIFRAGTSSYDERMRIKSNGNVGIGTENPGIPLDLYNSGGTDCLRLNVSTAAGGSSKQNAIRFSVDSTVKAHMGVAVDAGRLVSTSSANDFCLKTNQATDIILAPNGVDRLHIASTGDVSIGHGGEHSGSHRLWVESPGVSISEVSFEDQSGTGQLCLAGSNSHVRLQFGTMDTSPYGGWIQASYDNTPDGGGTGSSGTEPLLINPKGGNVGIATATLSHVLHTFGAGNAGGVRFENSHTTTTVSGNTASGAFPHNILLSNYQGSGHAVNRMTSIGFDIPTTGSHANATIAFQAKNSSGNGDLQFWLENDNTSRERLRITSEGNVGINESTPSSHLHIVSTSTTSDILRLEAKPVTASTGERSRIVFHITQSNGQAARLAHIASWSQDNWGGQLAFNFKPANSTPNDTTVEAFRINQSGMAATSGRMVVDSYVQAGGYNNTNESFANVVAMFSARDLSAGTMVSGQTDTISGYARKRLSSDANGTFFFGPYGAFPAGDYTALFRLKVSSNSSSSACGYLDIIGNGITAEGRNKSPYTSSCRIDLVPSDFTTSNLYQYFAIDFSKSNSAANIETRWLNAQNNSLGIDLYIDHILILPRLSHGVEGVTGMHDY